MTKRTLLIFTLVLLNFNLMTMSFAAEQQTSNSNQQTSTVQNDASIKLAGHLTSCPPPETLVNVDHFWQAAGGWHSYYASFGVEVNQFNGAHWIGVDYGKIICFYHAADKLTFPIQLENSFYVKRPTGHLWGHEINGVTNCLGRKVSDCPFEQVIFDSGSTDLQSLINLKPKPVTTE